MIVVEQSVLTVGELIDRGEAEVRTGPFGTQLHASDYTEKGTPVINVRNIGFGGLVPEKLEYIDDETVERLSGHVLQPGDIVFGRKGAVERHAFIQDDGHKWFQGSDCIRLRVQSEFVDNRFLSFSFLSHKHRDWMMNQSSHGATMASLNQDIVKRIPLLLPPIEEQRRIASILSAYDDLIDNNRRRIEILEEMARNIYREWFVHFRFPGHEDVQMVDSPLGPIPEGWEVKWLGDIAESVRRSEKAGELDEITPYVGLEHIPRRSIALTEWQRVSSINSTKLAFEEGEILFGKIRPYFHKVSIAPISGLCSSDAIVIRGKEEGYMSLVLSVVSSDEFVEHATQTSQGTKMPRANWDVLVEYPVPIPPPELYSRYECFLTNVVQQIRNLVFRTRNLASTRDLLLPRIISGQISASQPLDLLEARQ